MRTRLPALRTLASSTYRAGVGEGFEAAGDSDVIDVDVVGVDDDVAEIDAHAHLDAPVDRNVGVALGHAALHFDRAAHRIDNAGKLDQDAVAGGLDDAA